MSSRAQRLLAEFVGTLLLALVVVGSGIAAARLTPGNIGLELTENALATALGLFVILSVFGPISGAHLNPLVSLIDAIIGRRPWLDVLLYVPAQLLGCCAGAVIANLAFGTAAVSVSSHDRLTPSHFLSEVVATAGLILVIFLLQRWGRGHLTPAAVGAYIGAAYLFTSSTGFANPAMTIGRMLTNSFAGIAPPSVLGFIGAQIIGAVVGLVLVLAFTPKGSVPVNRGFAP